MTVSSTALGGFDAVPPPSLDWSYRNRRLLEEVLRHKSAAGITYILM